jgi:hypothetical protein
MKMRDNPDFRIEIQIKDNDINVISASSKDFVLNQRDKSLLLIAVYQLKEKIKNNELDIEVQEC